MKIIHIIFASIIISTTITSCSSARLTYEDVNKELEEAEEAKESVKIEMQEAIDAREQYYKDYKLTKIEEFEKKIKSVDKQISGIEKQQTKTSNEEANASLKEAISSLKAEKETYQKQINDMKEISPKSWQESRNQVHESVEEIEIELDHLDKSLDGFEEK